MKQNFTGYRVPKTLNFNDITVFEDIKLKKDEKLKMYKSDKYYYIFYNNNLKNYAIPQLCNSKSQKDILNLKNFLNYLKSDMTKAEMIKEIFVLSKQKFALEILQNKKERINNIKYDKLEKSGKFIIKHNLQPA